MAASKKEANRAAKVRPVGRPKKPKTRGRPATPLLKQKRLNAKQAAELRAIKQYLKDKGVKLKRGDLTQKDYLTFLQNAEKANRKIRKAKKGKHKAILEDVYEVSTQLQYAHNREQLERWTKRAAELAKRRKKGTGTFEEQLTREAVEHFCMNMRKGYDVVIFPGDVDAAALSKLVGYEPALKMYLYYLKEEAAQRIADLIDTKAEDIVARVVKRGSRKDYNL